MTWNVLTLALYSAGWLFGAEQLNLAICNQGHTSERNIAIARTEAELLFRNVGIEIVWRPCRIFPSPAKQKDEPWFVVRVRGGRPPRSAGSASLDTMGKAYVAAHKHGSLADLYIEAVQQSVDRYGADTGMLLGFVMAHELGHLLLGPGHADDGIMRAAWTQPEMSALRQRWLRFTQGDAARLRSEISGR